MVKKVLYTANTYNHLYLCHRHYLKWFKENGFLVHTATNSDKKLDSVDVNFCVPVRRTPYSFNNVLAIFKLKK